MAANLTQVGGTDPVKRISDLENSVEYLRTVSKLEQGQQRLLDYTRTLEDYCLELDVSVHKRHLILTGIPEDPTEEPINVDELDNENNANATHKIALGTLLSIHDTLVYEDIDCAYRIGKKSAKARPILIKFCKESIRDVISKKRKHLKDVEETKSVYLNDDLPSQINQQRADMRAIVENAHSKNVAAKVVGNRVQVANKTYGYRDLHALPNGLKLENAKTKVTAKGLAFQGEHSIFSNFYPIPVRFNGRTFPS